MTVSPLLDVRGVVSGYGGVQILKGVSIFVDPGEIVTIIGPNGAGKSTLMKAIFGLLPVYEGEIWIDSQQVTGLPTETLVRMGVGFVPQTNNVFSTLTVRENLEMGAFIREGDISEQMSHVLDIFPALIPRLGERAGRLSGGERQMVALGRALMLDPKILLLDEPSASLSPKMSETVFEKISEINQLGMAAVIVEQDARHALAMSHRGYVLTAGENRIEGPADLLLDRNDVRKLYLGG